MHVAYIHQHFSTRRGATGTRSYEMSRRLIARGHRVTMICGAYEASDLGEQAQAVGGVQKIDIDGIRVLRIAQPYANRMSLLQRALAFGRFARKATQVVRGLDADLVFATSTPLTTGIPGMKGAASLGVPFVFEVRDLWPELPIALGAVRNRLLIAWLRRLERRIYRAATSIIGLAPGICSGIARAGYPADRIVMIPNCCDLDLFTPSNERTVDERFGPPEALKLVFTGAHGLANGLDAVLDAVGELKRRGVHDVRFIFIGQGGQRERLIERSRREGLDELTVWIGPMPKQALAALLPRLDVGLMALKNVPAFYEGTSPNKFFDYIASGLPVLNNYPGWLAGMIRDFDCGVVVQPDDPSAFANTVQRLAAHREQLKPMGLRGRELAERSFGRDLLGERFVDALEAAAEPQKAAGTDMR